MNSTLYSLAHVGMLVILMVWAASLALRIHFKQHGLVPNAILDLTAFTPVLKTLYPDEKIWDLAIKKHPLLAWLSRDKNFVGEDMKIPIQFGNPNGCSHTFSKGKTNKAPSKYSAFTLTRKKDYGFITIDNETIQASKSDPGAFLRARSSEIDGLIAQMGRRMAMEVYGNGSGVRGQISAVSNPATPTITLANLSDIAKFEVDQTLEVSAANDGSGVVRVGSVKIASLDRDAGTITATGNWTAGIAACLAGDYISVAGDYGLAVSGLDAWLPAAAPGAAAFYGVDRSVDVTRLGGNRYDGTNDSMHEALIKMLSKNYKWGGMADGVFMAPVNWTALELELGAKVTYFDPDDEATGRIGFTAIKVNYEGGVVPVFSDIDCPTDTVYGLQSDTIKIRQLGEAPTIFKEDGLAALRSTDEDGIDVQAYGYWNLSCRAPGYNVRAKITPAAYF
jgi:hypothetical protein